MIFFLMCIGIHAGGESLVRELRPSPAERNIEDGEEISLTGQLYQKEIKDEYQILYLKNNSINSQGKSLKESKIIVYDESKIKLHIGQLVQTEGKVSFFEPAYNPGNFDQKLYYQKQDIHARVWAGDIHITDERKNVFFDCLYELRQRWKSVFQKNMRPEDATVLAAMLLGEKGDMGVNLKELYQVNGIGHILAKKCTRRSICV